MNKYLADATYCFRRAVSPLNWLTTELTRESLYDAIIYYAFGIEKVCKAVVHDVNPMFLLENPKFENAAAVLYADRLDPVVKRKFDKEVNRNLLPFNASLLMAARFSKVIEDHIAAFTYLADLRGIVAHRSIDEMDAQAARHFLLKTFQPTVEKLAQAFGFDWHPEGMLVEASEALNASEDFAAKMTEHIDQHRAIWDTRKTDRMALAEALRRTRTFLDERTPQCHYPLKGLPIDCPACGQQAILAYRVVYTLVEVGVESIGQYVSGLYCEYCTFKLHGYGEVDYFKLNERLNSLVAGLL